MSDPAPTASESPLPRVVFWTAAGMTVVAIGLALAGHEMAEGRGRTLAQLLTWACVAMVGICVVFDQRAFETWPVRLSCMGWAASAGVVVQIQEAGADLLWTPVAMAVGAGAGAVWHWWRAVRSRMWRRIRSGDGF